LQNYQGQQQNYQDQPAYGQHAAYAQPASPVAETVVNVESHNTLATTTTAEETLKGKGLKFTELFCCAETSLEAAHDGLVISRKTYCCAGRRLLLSSSKVLIPREGVNYVSKVHNMWYKIIALGIIVFFTGIGLACVTEYNEYCDDKYMGYFSDCPYPKVKRLEPYKPFAGLGIGILFAGIFIILVAAVLTYYHRVTIYIGMRQGHGSWVPFSATFMKVNAKKAFKMAHTKLMGA